MRTTSDITGIILAGGKSRRMGNDKAMLLYKGKTFIEHIISALQPLVKNIIIVSDDKEYDRFGLKRVADQIKNSGPLAGVYSGLHHSNTELNIVLSCDVPLIDSALLKLLIKEDDPSLDVVQFQSGDKTIPLIALYKKRCADTCLSLLNSGERRLRVLAEHLNAKTIILGKDSAHKAMNFNTKQDLNLLKNDRHIS